MSDCAPAHEGNNRPACGTFRILQVNNGTMSTEYHRSVIAAKNLDSASPEVRGSFRGEEIVQSGANISKARNETIRRFLATGDDWAWFVDADIVFDSDAPWRLLAAANRAGTKIMGGLYVMVAQHGPAPHLYIPGEDGRLRIMLDYPDGTIQAVAGTGFGCLMVHRDVFTDVEKLNPGHPFPWVTETVIGDRWVSEDISFCLLAAQAGHQPFVDCTTHVGHHKGGRIWWPEDIRKTSFGDAPTWVVIPSKHRGQMLRDLVGDLRRDGGVAGIILCDNGLNAKTRNWADSQDDIVVLGSEGKGIHEMWNSAVDWVLDRGTLRSNLAFLNDDLRLGEGCIPALSRTLRAPPHGDLFVVSGNYDGRECGVDFVTDIHEGGGMAGFCFMVRSEFFASGYRFPEACKWWYGDNDLVIAVGRSGGKIAVVGDAEVTHLDGGSNTLDRDDPEMAAQLAADRDAWLEMHPELTLVRAS